MGVIIGVDPHKGSHTAVAIGGDEARAPALSRGVLPVCKDDAREARATRGRRR
jgi:hypothetical protein